MANSADSLSGWLSLLSAAGAADGWPGEVTFTSAHIDSVRALAEGDSEAMHACRAGDCVLDLVQGDAFEQEALTHEETRASSKRMLARERTREHITAEIERSGADEYG